MTDLLVLVAHTTEYGQGAGGINKFKKIL